MRQISKYILIFSFLMVAFICLPATVSAQGDPGCDPLCNCRADGTPCPIDGGVTALLAAGVIYGIKKYKGAKENEIQPVIDDD
jgi:hypothetical protein